MKCRRPGSRVSRRSGASLWFSNRWRDARRELPRHPPARGNAGRTPAGTSGSGVWNRRACAPGDRSFSAHPFRPPEHTSFRTTSQLESHEVNPPGIGGLAPGNLSDARPRAAPCPRQATQGMPVEPLSRACRSIPPRAIPVLSMFRGYFHPAERCTQTICRSTAPNMSFQRRRPVLNVHALFHGSMRRTPVQNAPAERRANESHHTPQRSTPKNATVANGPARRPGADAQMSQRAT